MASENPAYKLSKALRDSPFTKLRHAVGLLDDEPVTQRVEPVGEDAKPAKPAGWTQAELLDECAEADAPCSAATFKRIREDAKIKPSKNGDHGRRYSAAELRKLAEKARERRNGLEIAAAWENLLDA